jgi:general secretion pathway protein K
MQPRGETRAAAARRQQGLALVVALLMTALMVVLAVEVAGEARVNLRRVQNSAIGLTGHELAQAGIEAAKVLLARDLSEGAVDDLQEAWARPWGPYRVGDAEVSVQVTDANGHLNLNNVVGSGGQADLEFVEIVRSLYRILDLDPALVDPLVDWLDADEVPFGTSGAESKDYGALSPPYRAKNAPLDSLQELLAVRGYSEAVLQKLGPYVSVLPKGSLLNVNTAPPEVLLALQPRLGPEVVRDIEAARQANPFRTVRDLTDLSEVQPYSLPVKWLTTASQYFLITSTIHLPAGAVTEQVLLDRAASPMRVLARS